MTVLTEQAKRAEKIEIGDLALEVIGKTIRVYEIVSASKLKQIAYSDTLQRDRFLMFTDPSKKVLSAKDFTIARLYKKPENARKVIASYFPKYAAAGARVHLYYSGSGPRGRSGASGEGYFSVQLGMGTRESDMNEVKGIPKPKKYKVNKTSREFKMGQRAFEQGKPTAPALNKKLMQSFKGKRSDEMMQMMTDYAAGWHAANLAAPVESIGEAFKYRVEGSIPNQASIAATLDDYKILSGIKRISMREFDATFKANFYASDDRRQVDSLKAQMKVSKRVSPLIAVKDDEGYYILEGGHRLVALGELGAKDIPAMVVVDLESAGESIDEKRAPKVQIITGTQGSAFMFMPVPLTPYWWTGSKWSDKKNDTHYYDKSGVKSELGNARAAAQKLVKRLGESIDEVKFMPGIYIGPEYTVGDRVRIVRRFGWKKGYRPVAIKPPVNGKVTRIDTNIFYPKGPKKLTLRINPKDYGRASPGVVHTEANEIIVQADEVEYLKGSMGEGMDERFDPKAAHDYVKGLQNRKRRAYAREYLKAIQGARLPPRAQEFKITTQDAKEVQAGFKRIGAPLAASVQRNYPTFEQVAKIVRRAKCAGFSPDRISLNERFDSSGVPTLRRGFTKQPKKSPISTEDYIFVVHDDEEDTYSVGISVHDDPRLGYQELQTGLSLRAANRFERKMKARWKAAKVRRFLKVGYGHERKWLPESDEEKTKRIKDAVDLEVKDPKNKTRNIVQTLLAMFGRDVNELGKKWPPAFTPEERREARKFVDRMAQKHYDGKGYTKAETAQLKKINLRFRGEQVSIDAVSLLHAKSAKKPSEDVNEAGVPALQGWKLTKGMNKLGVNAATHRHGKFTIMLGKDKRYHLFKGGKALGDYESAKAAVKIARGIKESLDEARKWSPIWSAISGRRSWVIADQDGKLLRRPKEGNVHQAYAFETADKALAFLGSSKGRKAVTTQESIDERRPLPPRLAMISKAAARSHIERLGKEYKKNKQAGDSEKAMETLAVMRGIARMANMDPDAALKLSGVTEGDQVLPVGEAFTVKRANGTTLKVYSKKEAAFLQAREDAWKKVTDLLTIATKTRKPADYAKVDKAKAVFDGTMKALFKKYTPESTEEVDEIAGHPPSKEEGWRAKRSAWQKEYRAIAGQFPELKDNKVVYDYGLVRTFKVEHLSKNKKVKLALGTRIGKFLLKRGYKLVGPGAYETDKFKAQVLFTQTLAILKVSCRRVDSAFEARTKVINKQPQEEVNYRKSEDDSDERCGNCAFIVMPDECKRVRGKIDQDFTCDLWKRGVAEDLDEVGLTKAEQETLSSIRAARRMGVLRKHMDPAEIKAANSLVKKGFVSKGTSDDRQRSVQYVAEDLDEAAAQGKVQAALLDFVKKLPPDSEFTLSDVLRRQEFRGVHFKRLMSAAKALEKKGLIWYDGFSNVGPSRA